jgi:hypothetical protein
MVHEPKSPASRSTGLRPRALWHRCWGTCAALLGIALLLAAVAVLLIVPDLMADERAFLAARPCTAAVTDDCLHSVQATVRGTVIREQPKNSEYTLTLDGPRPVPGELDMDGSGPLLKDLRAGEKVTVTVWRDYATAVSKDGVTQHSSDTPEGEPQFAVAGALAVLPVGAFAVYAGGNALVRARTYAARGLPGHFVPLGKRTLGAALCALPAGAFGMWRGGPIAVAVSWVLLAGLVWAVTSRLEARGRGRHARPVTG